MRISDWSSDVCSSDLGRSALRADARQQAVRRRPCRRNSVGAWHAQYQRVGNDAKRRSPFRHRSEEHTSELQSLMRISYAVFCLKKKKTKLVNKSKDKTLHIHSYYMINIQLT